MSSHGNAPQAKGHGPVEWCAEDLAVVEEIFGRYPTKRAATLPLRGLAPRRWDWLSLDVIRLVARTVEIPASDCYAVASFYSMFKKQPTGKYFIQVCHTLSCALRGADAVVEMFAEVCGIDPATGSSPDGMFTLLRVECLAACHAAPMAQINDDFYEMLDRKRVEEIVAAFRSGQPLPTPRPEVDRWIWDHAS